MVEPPEGADRAARRSPIREAVLRATQRLLIKPALSPRWSLPAQRRWLEGVAAIGRQPDAVVRESLALGGVAATCWRDARAPACRRGAILLLHGGAYCVGSARTHASLTARLARDTGLPVYAIDYRLAPEHPFPAALDDAIAAFTALSEQGPVLVVGDSAGGGLSLSLALELCARGGPQAVALGLLSPWVDLRPTHVPAEVASELMLSPERLQTCARHYAGERCDDPRVSPLLADLRGLPAIRLHCCSHEMLAPQARALDRALRAAEVRCEFSIAAGPWHVQELQAGLLPSADAAVAELADFLLRELDAAAPADASSERTYEVVVLGAGMSGLCTALQLQRAGLHDFVMLEQSEGLGGTWWDNRYPGAQVDVPAPAYSFSFAPNPHWRQRFADASQILDYQRGLAREHGLSARLRLGTRLAEAVFDEAAGLWRFRTAAGERFSARFFVCSTGPLSQPRWPEIPGIEEFKGLRLHSARWDAHAPLQGLRVGVIGTGSTGVQLIPPIAAQAAQLHVFQRTPNWVLPRLERKYRWFDRVLARLPPYSAVVRWAWVQFLELTRRGFEQGSLMRRFMLWLAARHRRQQVADATLRERLTPDYPLGCKRIIYASDYYPSLSRANVELVTAAIERVTATGIRCKDGSERPLDALVCATGFETVHLLQSLQIRGRAGLTLAEAWQSGPEAYHGISVAGFPNLFLMLGPNTATGHTSTLLYIEPSVRHAIACMKAVLDGGHQSIEVRADVMRAHNAGLQERLAGSVWSQCQSWYRMDGGKVVAIFPGFTHEFVQTLSALPWTDFRFGAAPAPVVTEPIAGHETVTQAT